MIEQRSSEWFKQRLGHVTGSRLKDVLAEIKSGEAAARKNYRTEKVIERLTGQSGENTFESEPMRRGTEKEPYARVGYCDLRDVLVTQVGFRLHPTIKWWGCSVDSEVEPGVGGMEVKCPNTAQHISALINGMDSGHKPQVQGNMAVMGWKWCDFVSFDDRMPEGLQLYVERIMRDDVYIKAMEEKVKAFLAEVEATIKALRAKIKG